MVLAFSPLVLPIAWISWPPLPAFDGIVIFGSAVPPDDTVNVPSEIYVEPVRL